MRVLIDTNVLVRLAELSHPSHLLATEAIQSLRIQGHDLFIVPQSIYEFWAVATRSRAANGLEKSPAEARAMIRTFRRHYRLLKDERFIYDVWLRLMTDFDVSGVKSFDARLVAAMLRHGITHLLTFNASDFRRYQQISIIDPEHMDKSH